MFLLGKYRMKKSVMGVAELLHTPYNGEIELTASKGSSKFHDEMEF